MFFEIRCSLVPPKKPTPRVGEKGHAERLEAVQEVLSTPHATKLPLKARISRLSNQALALCQDRQTILGVLKLLEITSRACDLGGMETTPYAHFFLAPIYLYHATKLTLNRLKLMLAAAKVQAVAKSYFWLSQGLEGATSAIANVAKAFSGSVEIAGAKAVHTFGLLFSTVVPIVFMVAGSVGGIAKGWAYWRNTRLLKQMKHMGDLHAFLTFLQGSTLVRDHEDANADAAALARFHHDDFMSAHFTSPHRFKVIEEKMRVFIGSDKKLQLPQDPLSVRIQAFLTRVAEGMATRTELDGLADELEAKLRDPELAAAWKGHQEVLDDVITGMRSDISRKMYYNAYYVLIALLLIALATLMITGAGPRPLNASLAITLCVLKLGVIVFDKGVSQEKFEKLFNSWKARSNALE